MDEIPGSLIADSQIVGEIRLPGKMVVIVIDRHTGYHAFPSPDTPADDSAG